MVGPVAYTLELPEELSNVHSTFHVSNLKKCLSDESLAIPMKELRLDDKLNFVENPIEIMVREVKQLKQSRYSPKENDGYSFTNHRDKVFVPRNAEFLENDVIDHKANDLCLYVDAEGHELGDIGEPANYKAVLLDLESDKWLNAMNVEMQSMKDSEVWELVDLPPDGKTVDIRAIRILIAIVSFYDYEIWQMDVKTAFLNVYLNEDVYMEQPGGYVSQKFPNRKFGFSKNRDEPCVYVKSSRIYVTFLILYVDDILIMGNNIPMLQDVKSYLGKCFAMKDLGEAAYILGIKIY
ncbi:retrotransposon protein, putative, ty1-copia subclass [Tanacetum coccineum]